MTRRRRIDPPKLPGAVPTRHWLAEVRADADEDTTVLLDWIDHLEACIAWAGQRHEEQIAAWQDRCADLRGQVHPDVAENWRRRAVIAQARLDEIRAAMSHDGSPVPQQVIADAIYRPYGETEDVPR